LSTWREPTISRKKKRGGFGRRKRIVRIQGKKKGSSIFRGKGGKKPYLAGGRLEDVIPKEEKASVNDSRRRKKGAFSAIGKRAR